MGSARGDGLVQIATGFLLAAVAVNWWRSRSATDAGGAGFSSEAPASNILTGALGFLIPMQLSADGEAFIKQNEGFTRTTGADAGHQVIGWGHDIQPGENISSPITTAAAQILFDQDVATAEAAVNGSVSVALSQDQFDALVDLAFNIGAAAFSSSTLVRLLNQGDYAGAAAQFAQWDKSGGQVNAGLQNRRSAEQGMFSA